MTPKEALDEAARIVGGKATLAREIGVSKQALGQWKSCLPEYVLKVESAVATAVARQKRGISRYDLRPDIFGKKP